jgi:hypothetical protein
MALTDVTIRNAKPGLKPRKLADSGGLHLLISPAGGKLWRLKYRFDGKEKQLAIGPYPDISLSEARKRRDEARALLAGGKDPNREKKRDKVKARAEAENPRHLKNNENLGVRVDLLVCNPRMARAGARNMADFNAPH